MFISYSIRSEADNTNQPSIAPGQIKFVSAHFANVRTVLELWPTDPFCMILKKEKIREKGIKTALQLK